MAAKIKKGDKVVVLTGRDKGRKRRSVARHAERRHAPSSSGVNLVKRHQRQTQTAGRRHHHQGSRRSNLSNLAIADPKDGKPTRVGFKILDDGRKVRVAKRSGDLIDG